MLRLVDVSRYQIERPVPLDLAKVRESGHHVVNVALTGGRGYVSGAWAGQYLEQAWVLQLGRSTYHWLDGRTPGAAQAAANLTRLRDLFGTALTGFAHFADVEETGEHGITPPTWNHVRDYVNAMQDGLGRHIGIYSGDWWWDAASRRWPGSTLTPWLMGQPNTSLAGVEPGPDHAAWTAGWGGWPTFAVLQYAANTHPTLGSTSRAVIRDHGVWADLTGGDVLMPAADPGNAQPEAWIGPPVVLAALPDLIDAIEFAQVTPEWTGDVEPEPDGRAAAEVCAPTIVAEHADWKALGGTSNGCVGNEAHGTGFHRGANFVPATDYSRRRDPNGADGPFVNWNYACAGDFRHGGNPALRDLGRIVLAELMAGHWTNVGEFIGQPWANRPVMYWSRWEGVLREYTGSGHDTWFHVSWYRSRVNQNTHIWTNAVKIRDGVDMPITDADVDRMLARDAIKNPKQRADSVTNPTTSWGFAVGDVWQQTLNLRDQITGLSAQVDLLGKALMAAVKNADDGQAVLDAINNRAVEVVAAQKAAEAAEIQRDTDNVARLLAVIERISGGGTVTTAQLAEALRIVYADAFTRAVNEHGPRALGQDAG